ncbi:right-handed parallel beta-helix repeat-containing protein [Paenalkalicoccus suaedae]|uniref:Right-handed parallel beta-helix repeat-containing protein n=2 Tax=Paenalkalicoccus suaedae TaxID=2592382 RepID=A0A859FKN3_9BACI|nr:right-handed parallel beta-helix repeat-containing protein [Paenalkalicoccus suaedae]QKS73367.1 right-handed parallel beta-helix repeat-containing protein [Paenalkalicoccus suaedae]
MVKYHVAKTGSDQAEGTEQQPFLSINKAAGIAQPGDTIIVHEGEYREWVKPQFAGTSHHRRITYEAAKNESVIIKGSEHITGWEQTDGTVWKVKLPNTFFGEFNPFNVKLFGDWIVENKNRHLGDVYLNGMSFYEAETLEEVQQPQERTEVTDHWTRNVFAVKNPEQTTYVWYAEVDAENTTIYANFHDANPNEELVEINVRQACFYPDRIGVDYITVRGFEMAQAATPWTPPTADQPGLIGPHWSKGWIIEHNRIHDAKCSAISIGKEASTGHNDRSIRKDKPGYQYQLESVFKARQIGWHGEKIGSHIIRHNSIYDCGQNAIVGHLGCVFSEIYNNHIYNIAIKREFFGHEIAGIKLHAAIDVHIHHNRIHDCSLGAWLDWQTQGTRVSSNLFYANSRDLFVEVSSGPYVVDHNILTADYALDNHAQGGAYINNLIRGRMVQKKMLDRATPYHVPHSTEVSGFAPVYGGDDRYYNNIFIGDESLEPGGHNASIPQEIANDYVGTVHFNGYTASLDGYIDVVNEEDGDHRRFHEIEQPVYINRNAYYNGAQAFDHETENHVEADVNPAISIVEQEDGVYLSIELPENFTSLTGEVHGTHTLGRARLVDAEFDNADGSDLVLDTDYLGEKKAGESVVGPLASLKAGSNFVKVWG